jgi:hypothetical protein
MAPLRSPPMEPGPERIGSPGTGDGVRPDCGASAVDLTSHPFLWRKGPFSHGKSRPIATAASRIEGTRSRSVGKIPSWWEAVGPRLGG